MILRDVYDQYEVACVHLFALLREREPHESISHKAMPSFADHCAFVAGQPYEAWYLIEADDYVRGAIYLTDRREIGIAIYKGHRGHGYAEDAITELMRRQGGGFLANINPENTASLMLFRKLGFGGPVQVTLEKP